MPETRRRRATVTIALIAAVIAAIGVGVPAVTGAEASAPPVDYRSLWDRFPLEQPGAAEPAGPADPGAAPTGSSDGGAEAPLLIGLGLLGAVGLGTAALVLLRRRRRRRPRPVPGDAVATPEATDGDAAGGAARAPTASAASPAAEPSDPLYNDATCRVFASGLSDEVLDRAVILFTCLARQGRVDAARLSAELGARSSDLGGLLLTPLTRRAGGMRLPLPYEIAQMPASRRRAWRDEAGIARRMSQALRDEEDAREAGVDDEAGRLDVSALAERLRAEPGRELVLSLADLERLIGDPLPESMARRRWWSNRPEAPGHPQAAAWMTAGWRAYPELRQGRVRFRRVDTAARPGSAGAHPAEG